MNPQDQAIEIALTLLSNHQSPTPADFSEAAKNALRATGEANIDLDTIIRELETRCSVSMGDFTELVGNEDHVEWLPQKENLIKWSSWDLYEKHLRVNAKLPRDVIAKQKEVARHILSDLEDPERKGPWDRRGLVAGHVQSGKTSNYIGLICKAADAGYKVIIVLSGIHKSLRSQTQERIDEGFLGRDTSGLSKTVLGGKRIGVGKILGLEKIGIASLTTAHDVGDFNRNTATQAGYPLGKIPIVFVIKKNKSILTNLLTWLQDNEAATFDSALKRNVLKETPALIIDDEADNASVNTKDIFDEFGNLDPELDPSAINQKIREVVSTFKKVAYVGYTATPYANIFIYPVDKNPLVGEDLFPRSFIINLKAPSNYIGPETIFGLRADGGAETELPLIVKMEKSDYSGFIPDTHRKNHIPKELPLKLQEAIQFFILSAAGRAARGQDCVHNSMLIHVTRFTDVQQHIYDLVEEYTDGLKLKLKYSDAANDDKVMDEFYKIWKNEYSDNYASIVSSVSDKSLTPLPWKLIKKFIKPAAQKITYKKINGTATDILDYKRNKDKGLTVIAIGGDKLSRGLTLEGLTVSYYLRASRMYDTLMQMGRWFGYRDGYLDLCRIYTSEELVSFYQDITFANAELRREFDNMAADFGTPADYGLKVRTSPLGLQITAANKIRTGKDMRLSYSERIAELYAYKKDPHWIEHQRTAAEKLIRDIGKENFSPKGSAQVATGVNAKNVIEYLSKLNETEKCPSASPKLLKQFIEAQLPNGHLTEWTIAVISKGDGDPGKFVFDVNQTKRDDSMNGKTEYYILKQRRLITPTHENLDFEESELKTLQRGKRRDFNPLELRRARPSSRGLLLLYPLDPVYAGKKGGHIFSSSPIIGYAFSFPTIPNAQEVEYTVNNVFWEQEFGGKL